MAQISWNYSNMNHHGKNIYFFRDTNHVSSEIQNALFGELERKITEGTFSILFAEGVNTRKKITSYKDFPSALKLFKQNYKDKIELGEIQTYKIDDLKSVRKYLKSMRRLKDLRTKALKEDSSKIYHRIARALKEEKVLDKKRIRKCVKEITKKM